MKLLAGCCLFGVALGYAAFDDKAPATKPTPAPSPVVPLIEDPLLSRASAVLDEQPYGPPVPPNFVPTTPEERAALDDVETRAQADLLDPLTAERLVQEILGSGSEDISAIDVLARDVERLRKELNATVGQGADTKSALLEIEGYDKELESLGIHGDLANEIRSLYPEVQSLRGELMLLDLRTQKSETSFKPLTAGDAGATEEAANPNAEAPQSGVEATRIERAGLPRTDFPKLEAMLHFAKGDRVGSAEILSHLPDGELDPSARFALGSSYVAERRFTEARAVLKSLIEDQSRPVLAAAAQRQMKRMEMIEAGLVDVDPLTKQIQEDAK